MWIIGSVVVCVGLVVLLDPNRVLGRWMEAGENTIEMRPAIRSLAACPLPPA